MNTKPTPGTKVIPFTGEFYQSSEPSPPPPEKNSLTAFVLLALCLVAVGAAMGATAAYQAPDQVQLRSLQAESEQLSKLKDQLCR